MTTDTKRISPTTRYEWYAVAVHDNQTIVDVRGICKYYTTAVREVETELADAPCDADAYGSVRGLTVTFVNLNHADGVYRRWDSQAVAVRGEDGEVSWFRDRNADGDGDGAGSGSVGA